MARTQLNVRVPQTTIDQIAALTERGYESQAHVIIIAVNNLYREEISTVSIKEIHVGENNDLHLYAVEAGKAIKPSHKPDSRKDSNMATATTITISTGTYDLEQLAKLVAAASERGEWYDGEGFTIHIEDWLAEGDYDGSETVESLATEWDAE